ncbi:hypothetical protein FXV83_29580 [Bradyrhizobium hipponense]|uniref:Uncharacterized protein n=1 Tax=Bradyrhizobium hipponense TaxID=2605638 RepID=A0A5S4YG53_9BRAD|nr:hypothetical protein [Bradyrhizobium hipponense]TYO63058.1 hypothetical protein FXV83_29580 [Bradyrhizobium hipponense]
MSNIADAAPNNMRYGLFMGAVGILMIGWTIAYGYANYQSDECLKSAKTRIDSIRTHMVPGNAAKQGK